SRGWNAKMYRILGLIYSTSRVQKVNLNQSTQQPKQDGMFRQLRRSCRLAARAQLNGRVYNGITA
ncbi:hypothetical protein K0M31_000470, partial [Melipona bicolor]